MNSLGKKRDPKISFKIMLLLSYTLPTTVRLTLWPLTRFSAKTVATNQTLFIVSFIPQHKLLNFTGRGFR